MHKAETWCAWATRLTLAAGVIDSTNELTHLDIGVALYGHLVMCPKCGGPFPLLATGPRTHRGRLVGYGRSARSHYVYEPGSFTPLAQVRGAAVFRDGEAASIHVDDSKDTRIPDPDV